MRTTWARFIENKQLLIKITVNHRTFLLFLILCLINHYLPVSQEVEPVRSRLSEMFSAISAAEGSGWTSTFPFIIKVKFLTRTLHFLPILSSGGMGQNGLEV